MENKVKVWLARDKDGELYAYSDIPVRFTRFWSQAPYITLGKPIFPSVKWEDDEPTEAYITLDEPQEQPKQEQPTPKQEIDWEQRRYEIAKEMMAELYRQKAVKQGQGINLKDIADFAVAFADMLIKELKKQSE